MRIVAAVLGLLALVSVPAHAAWLVKLKTGEVLTVQSYWRDGDKTHLTRGGVDIIVDNDRIESMEDGAPEPETAVQSATARTRGGAAAGSAAASNAGAPADAPAGDAKPVEAVKGYRERLDAMTTEELQAEQRRVSDHVLEVQNERFAAMFGGKSKEEIEAADKQFKAVQQRQVAADAKLKERQQP